MENEEKKFRNCFECNQECCKSVIVQIDDPETENDWENIKWQVAHHNVRVLKDNDRDWCVEFLTECDEMADDGKCKIYEKRPAMCRNHDAETCIINGEGDYYEVVFDCIGDVEEYLAEHPDAIGDEMVDVHTCPQCGCEFADDEEKDEEDDDESEER